MTDELRATLATVSEAISLNIPCVSSVRLLRDACDRVIADDEAATRMMVAGWCDEIFGAASSC